MELACHSFSMSHRSRTAEGGAGANSNLPEVRRAIFAHLRSALRSNLSIESEHVKFQHQMLAAFLPGCSPPHDCLSRCTDQNALEGLAWRIRCLQEGDEAIRHHLRPILRFANRVHAKNHFGQRTSGFNSLPIKLREIGDLNFPRPLLDLHQRSSMGVSKNETRRRLSVESNALQIQSLREQDYSLLLAARRGR